MATTTHKTESPTPPETGLEPAPDLSPAVVELLLRHYAGDFDPRVRTRLERIFADNPPDAVERLQRAAQFLGLTGEGLAEAEARAMARHRELT
jgi:hypothetical protein